MSPPEFSNRPFRWMGLGFLALGAFLAALFVLLAVINGRIEAGLGRADGTVREVNTTRYYDPDDDTETISSWAVIEYEVDGVTYRIVESSNYDVGEVVPVMYDRDNPADGRTTGSAFVFWILAAALGIPFSLAGLLIWVWARSEDRGWSGVVRKAARERELARAKEGAAPHVSGPAPTDGEFPLYPGTEQPPRDLR